MQLFTAKDNAQKWGKMEAFPAITLISEDAVLAESIPEQLMHALGATCQVATQWESGTSLPSIVILDTVQPDISVEGIQDLRTTHPLVGMIGIGAFDDAQNASYAELFATLPLAGFVLRPVSMPTLIRSLEHLHYARKMTADQQTLPLIEGRAFVPAKRAITGHASTLTLTDKETGILLCLYHHKNQWVTRQTLLEEVWGYNDDIVTHTLETHLYRLRSKLREALSRDDLIATKQGSYQLQC